MAKSILIAFIFLVLVILTGFILRINMENLTGYAVKDIKDTATCLQEKAILYGNNNHNTQLQLSIFGSEKNKINYVDCSEKRCDKENLPVWVINNNQYYGVYSIEELRDLANCN